jgi:hypothetical protein
MFDATNPVNSVRYIAGSATTSGRHALAAWFTHWRFLHQSQISPGDMGVNDARPRGVLRRFWKSIISINYCG